MGWLDKLLGRTDSTTAIVPTQATKSDGWTNASLGYGTLRDKSSQGSFCGRGLLGDQELSDMYYQDPIAALIVDSIPQEAFRRGYCLESKKNPDRVKALQEQLNELDADNYALEGATWGGLFGGALLILGSNNGTTQDKPLPPNAKGLKFLNVVDRRSCTVMKYYEDVFSTKYGKPEIYQIQAQNGPVSLVHETRVIRFDGIPVDTRKRRELAGWSYSVLQRPYERIRDFAAAFRSVQVLLSDASQGVFKINGLVDMISADEGPAVQERMRLVDQMRSALHSIILDAEKEDFTRITTPFTGMPELLDRIMMLLSSATGIPVAILMGRSAAGMNATGEGDARAFYDKVAAFQEKILTPVIKRVLAMLGDVPEDLEIEWEPLWEPSDKEKAETELLEEQAKKWKADAFMVYVTMGALTAGQVAIAEFGSGEGEIEIDEAMLEEIDAKDFELALNPPDPVMVAPGKPGQPGQPAAAKPAAKPNAAAK